MEKKRNQMTRSGQSNSDYSSNKKNQDVSSKQHYRRRKETFQSEYGNGNKQQQQQFSNKYRNNNNNFYYDKRPPARKNGNASELQNNSNLATGPSTRLTELKADDYELNSVFNHGSKKQNLNHLLNFHRYTKDSDNMHYRGAFSKHGYRHGVVFSKKYHYNKEQYLQANCQFIVKEDAKYDYKPFTITPDALVEWDQIVKILISSCEESQCPICLYPPKAAKMTKCGHLYCYSCMLHYLSLSDKLWRKCPICYESVYLSDLKSTTSRHHHRSYKVGDIINMELMNREKGSLFVNKANENEINEFPSFSDVQEETFTYSKLIMANKQEILKIIEQEKYELDFQLAEDGINCPESIFVQQAIEMLNLKKKEIEEQIENEQKQQLNDLQAENMMEQMTISENVTLTRGTSSISSSSATESMDDDLGSIIDDDCTLTLKDIDITSESSGSHSKHFFYYQAPNAQNIFLHAINSKMLQLMYGSLEKSPQLIRGKIVQIECCTMNEDLRKRLKYLQHLPVSTVFEVVEIEFEEGFVSEDVIDVFQDELLHRRKMRQRREREEKKREKAINEINDRQMGKILVASANIDICSSAQFPEYTEFNDAVGISPVSPPSTSSASRHSSFANIMTSPTERESETLWPSLAMPTNTSKSTEDAQRKSFFGDIKVPQTAASKKINADAAVKEEVEECDDDDDIECKAPAYKNNLSDALINALKSKASMCEANQAKTGKSKGKKGKKTLLFSSGMNFN